MSNKLVEGAANACPRALDDDTPVTLEGGVPMNYDAYIVKNAILNRQRLKWYLHVNKDVVRKVMSDVVVGEGLKGGQNILFVQRQQARTNVFLRISVLLLLLLFIMVNACADIGRRDSRDTSSE